MPACMGLKDRSSFQMRSGFRFAPIVTEPAREFEQNVRVVTYARRKRHGSSHALDAALAARDRAFAFAPASRARQDHVRKLGGMRVEKILDDHKFRPPKSLSAR